MNESEAEGARQRALGQLAHDLMQPLGAIANYAELIRQQSSGEVQEFAKEISTIAAKMAERVRSGLVP